MRGRLLNVKRCRIKEGPQQKISVFSAEGCRPAAIRRLPLQQVC
jgi:hypothetical protein